ncbi:transmembrane and coiled-coil domain-containing protein 4-like isoform X2 [Carya illinoinensis]|uniref:Uncharacterized protein n=1 Tax=Carya illinoinensis TaxID=32201 RepID=A0A8T1PWF9_CARIL|nr:transmembrane and coiled-coil domain-containing protein 4-like isoform X2 [Carya illinoinensis]KAG6648546.1 hypothetical protein CIPAW_07G154300 [Carya illinoinensis]
METWLLTSTQRYASAALFALALHQSQVHQTQPLHHLVPLEEEAIGEGASDGKNASVSEDPQLWVHEKSGLLWHVFRFLGVDGQAGHGLKDTAGTSSQVRHHVGAFLMLLSDESDGTSSERTDKELALTKAVDAMVLSMECFPCSSEDHDESNEDEKNSNFEIESTSDVAAEPYEITQKTSSNISSKEKDSIGSRGETFEKLMEEGARLSYQRKVTVLYVLLSACIARNTNDDKRCSQLGMGYDARHRVALRLLAMWLGVEWIKMEAMEIMVAFSIIASEKEDGAEEKKSEISESSWDKWKRGGIIGAAALTGGTLMAITGGLAAPAIAQGLGAIGFAAAASATGSVAGSAAVAASFGAAGAGLSGSKMARRIGSIEEFEFKTIGENINHDRLAVGIMVSGLAFEEEDFISPWKGYNDNLDRYALWWESKNLIALSSAIEDWLASRLALQLMKEGAMMTVLSALVAALALPATLVTASDLIDSQWAIAVDRSDKAGKLLAEVLLMGLHGNRCLQCLADTEGDNAGLVERVVLLGAPVSIKDENWGDARKIVAGRFVNAYSSNDWILGIIFRASLLSQGLAGIQAVDIPGIENVDVTHIIEGHSSYLGKTTQILEQLELDSYSTVFSRTHSKSQEECS